MVAFFRHRGFLVANFSRRPISTVAAPVEVRRHWHKPEEEDQETWRKILIRIRKPGKESDKDQESGAGWPSCR